MEPTTPTTPTNQQVRAARARHLELAREQGLQGSPTALPARKAFDLRDVKRAVVTQTPAAWAYLVASTHQGRILPQALSEIFGAHDDTLTITLDLAPHETGHHLVIMITKAGRAPHTFRLNAAHTRHIHPVTRLPSLRALTIAQDLLAQYHARFPEE